MKGMFEDTLKLVEEFSHQKRDFQRILAADIVIVSPPKAGRTWLIVLFAYLFHKANRLPLTLDAVRKFVKSDGTSLCIEFSHDLLCPHIPDQPFRIQKSLFNKKKVILLAREPLDMIV